jgi:hypothetical protein
VAWDIRDKYFSLHGFWADLPQSAFTKWCRDLILRRLGGSEHRARSMQMLMIIWAS